MFSPPVLFYLGYSEAGSITPSVGGMRTCLGRTGEGRCGSFRFPFTEFLRVVLIRSWWQA